MFHLHDRILTIALRSLSPDQPIVHPKVSHSVLFGFSPFTFPGAYRIASGKIVFSSP